MGNNVPNQNDLLGMGEWTNVTQGYQDYQSWFEAGMNGYPGPFSLSVSPHPAQYNQGYYPGDSWRFAQTNLPAANTPQFQYLQQYIGGTGNQRGVAGSRNQYHPHDATQPPRAADGENAIQIGENRPRREFATRNLATGLTPHGIPRSRPVPMAGIREQQEIPHVIADNTSVRQQRPGFMPSRLEQNPNNPHQRSRPMSNRHLNTENLNTLQQDQTAGPSNNGSQRLPPWSTETRRHGPAVESNNIDLTSSLSPQASQDSAAPSSTTSSSRRSRSRREIMDGTSAYTCSECGAGFGTATDLRHHHRNVHEDRPNGCNICGRSFVNPTHLRRHQRDAHQEEISARTHRCPHTDCKRHIIGFKRSDQLTRHLDAKKHNHFYGMPLQA